jgi:hypothetical protein
MNLKFYTINFKNAINNSLVETLRAFLVTLQTGIINEVFSIKYKVQRFEVKGLEGTKQNFALKTTYTMF